MKDSTTKDLYFKCTEYGLGHRSVAGNIKLTSFCLMNNHSHMGIEYENSSMYLSNFMRISHARFGYAFNKINGTSGKVANDRPKTPLIENSDHCMRVHFYIEANPIRANILKLEQLHLSQYSSYGFYAYGKKSKWSHLLTIPQWYLELGKTPKERQAKYRKLFREYLMLEAKSDYISKPFIGTFRWVENSLNWVRSEAEKRTKPPPVT